MTAQDRGGAGEISAGSSLPQEVVAAIVAAEHGDPFSVLGPHQLAPDLWEIRALVPGAHDVAVIARDDATVLARMRKVHEAGFFVAVLQRQDGPAYRLRIDWGGAEETRYDPYAFGEVL